MLKLLEIFALAITSEFLATDPEVRVRFPELPDFLRSCGSGTESLSVVSTSEEQLLEGKGRCSSLEMREYGRRDPSH
jgi:hypothetical protein